MKEKDRFYKALDFINLLPRDCYPRVGGSCGLWFYGKASSFNDVDIIVDKIPLSLPLGSVEKPLVHMKRLNKTLRIEYHGEIYDIHESIMPYVDDICSVEPLQNILKAREVLKTFFKVVYNEDVKKWED